MALVDTNGVYGAPRFYKAAKAVGVKALVGAELRLEDGGGPPARKIWRNTSANLPRVTLLVESRARLQEPLPPDHARGRGEAEGGAAGALGGSRRPRGGAPLPDRGGRRSPRARPREGRSRRGARSPRARSPTSSPGAFTSSSSGTGCPARSTATRRSFPSRGACTCRWWQPTACATRGPATRSCTT